MRSCYFDNAATSWPKPRSVMRAMEAYFRRGGGNPGRSGHIKAVDAGRVVLETREIIAKLFNVRDSSRIVFTKNATEALNIAIHGFVREGDHVVTTSMEHNSVMRPLRFLEERGARVNVVQSDPEGRVDADALSRELEKNTRLLIFTHASNVTGTINDIEAVGKLCRERSVPLLVDAAQTAGVIPVDVEKLSCDFLAFSGHKGLLGPQGTGGLFIREGISLDSVMQGGTGSLSDREVQPDFLPDRYESGTLNVIGIAGLAAGVRFLLQRGVQSVQKHDRELLALFFNAIGSDERIRTYGKGKGSEQTGVLSLNIAGLSPSKVGDLLDRRYGIMTRIGLHCAPGAHRSIGTFPDGTVRFSWGLFTRKREVLYAARALREIAAGAD